MKCLNCGIEFHSKRDSAKFCSPNCRVTYNRKVSVTHNPEKVSVTAPKKLSVTFKFTAPYNRKPGHPGYDADVEKNRKKVREGIYWYDIPLASIPVYQKGWPKMPEYMNGRQYFLWWKNEFEIKDDQPVILNPFPPTDNVVYVQAGEGSRRWGT